jgi:hypothetical protein
MIVGAAMIRFTIRDVLLVTVMVGLVLVWWIDRSKLVRERNFWKENAESFATVIRRDLGWEIVVTDDGVTSFPKLKSPRSRP